MGPPGPPGPKVSTYIFHQISTPDCWLFFFFIIMVCLNDNDTDVADVLLFIVIFFLS